MCHLMSCQPEGEGGYRGSTKTVMSRPDPLILQTYSRVTGNRNNAVLTMDRIEQAIKAMKSNERLEAQFREMQLSYVDSVGTCQDLIAESMDKVELLQAKLKLL